MNIRTKIVCPYCRHEGNFTAENAYGRELYYCCEDEGGCGGVLVVEYSAHLKTATRSIEGEERHADEQNRR